MEKKIHKKVIQSFVLRQGRITEGQKIAFARYWPKYGLDWTQPLDRVKPIILEIGFGMGTSLVKQAIDSPNDDFVGIEVHRPGIGSILQAIETNQLSNLSVFHHDAIAVLHSAILPQSVRVVQLFFPDPWPKKKHHKRRIVQPAFIHLIAQKLIPGGVLHMATDWAEYAEYMMRVMEDSTFERMPETQASVFIQQRPRTKFEMRGERLDHGIWDLVYVNKVVHRAPIAQD